LSGSLPEFACSTIGSDIITENVDKIAPNGVPCVGGKPTPQIESRQDKRRRARNEATAAAGPSTFSLSPSFPHAFPFGLTVLLHTRVFFRSKSTTATLSLIAAESLGLRIAFGIDKRDIIVGRNCRPALPACMTEI
jgi:hypothetical protein